MQFFDQIAALYGLVDQAFHSIQTVVDGIAGKQRLLDPGAEQPLAHGSAGLVQHPEQGAPLSRPRRVSVSSRLARVTGDRRMNCASL